MNAELTLFCCWTAENVGWILQIISQQSNGLHSARSWAQFPRGLDQKLKKEDIAFIATLGAKDF